MEFWSWLWLFIFCALFECISGRDCLFGVPPITRIILLRLLFSSQISTWGDSVPNRSIIDPFLCGCVGVCVWMCVWVFVFVCFCVCVTFFIAKDFANGQGDLMPARTWKILRMQGCQNALLQANMANRCKKRLGLRCINYSLVPYSCSWGFDAVPHNHVPPKQMLQLFLLPFDYLRIVGGRLGIQHRFWRAPSKPTLLATTSN